MMDEKTQITFSNFCRQVRIRSRQHKAAIGLLCASNLYAPAISTLRQELDSLIRLEYLLAERDPVQQQQLIEFTVVGKQWTEAGKRSRITDRAMVEAASTKHSWSALVYEIGCSFVHLSNLHDYQNHKPADLLPKTKLDELIRYLTYYQGALIDHQSTFKGLFFYVPHVFEKVSGNVEGRLLALETKMANDSQAKKI